MTLTLTRTLSALLQALARAETHTLTALDLSHNELWLEAGMHGGAGGGGGAAAAGEVSSDALTQLGAIMATLTLTLTLTLTPNPNPNPNP